MGVHSLPTGQAVRLSQLATAGLAALFLLCVTAGCQGTDRRVNPARSIPPEPTPGYVDLNRLLALHPDAPRLADLDRRLQRARAFPAAFRTPPLQTPAPLLLSTPEAPPAAPSPSREIDTARARTAIEEDFAIRRLARPEDEEQRYRRALERLRRRFLELRMEPRPNEDADDLAEALRNARRFSELEEQLRSLRERPEDRLFYTPAQLNRRRELFRLTQQEQEELRQVEMIRLEQSLDPTSNRARNLPKPDLQIPPAELARVERDRETRRQEALDALAKLERAALEAAAHTELPAPALEPADAAPPGLDAEELAPERERLSAQVAQSNVARTSQPATGAAASAASSLEAVRKLREQLRQHLLEEVQAAALSAARSRGITPTFTRGAAPDRTAQLAPEVVRLMSGRVRKGAR